MRSPDDVEKLAMLCRESVSSDALDSFHKQAQIVNRFVIAEFLQTDQVVTTLRREIRKLFDGVKVTDDQIRVILTNDVIKRDALDGDGPKAAKAMIKKAISAQARRAAKQATE
jgi:hypothetical protein